MNILEKIKALHAKANSAGTTEEEAAIFAAKVQELLVKHNLGEEVLNGPSVSSKIDRFDVKTPYNNKWRLYLAKAVAEMYFCKSGFWTVEYLDGSGKDFFHRFVGKEHNRLVAVEMFHYLEDTVIRLSKEYGHKLPKEKVAKARYEFEKGCGMHLAARVMMETLNAKKGNVTSSGAKIPNLPAIYSTELALVDEFLAENEDWDDAKKTKTKLDADGMAGVRAANGVSLNTQLTGTKSEDQLKIGEEK